MATALNSEHFRAGKLELSGSSLFGVAMAQPSLEWQFILPFSFLANTINVLTAAQSLQPGGTTSNAQLLVYVDSVVHIQYLGGTGDLFTVPLPYLSELTSLLSVLQSSWTGLSDEDLDGSSSSSRNLREAVSSALAEVAADPTSSFSVQQSATIADAVAPKANSADVYTKAQTDTAIAAASGGSSVANDLTSSTIMRPWHAALANRVDGPADIVCVGDSITEGYWATRVGARWVDVLRDDLRALFQVPDPGTLYPALGGTVVLVGNSVYNGTGGPGATLSPETDSATLTIAATGFDVLYVKGGGVGTATVQIDGGPLVDVVMTGGTTGDIGTYTIRGLIAGNHTIVVRMKAGSANPVIITAIRVYTGQPVIGGFGYSPAYHISGEFTGVPVSRSGISTLTNTYGLGRRSIPLSTTTNKLTLVDIVTGVDIHYLQAATGGNMLVSIDGATAVSVSTAGTDGVDAVYQIRNLTPTAHTIVVTGDGGATPATVLGFMSFRGDESCGIRMWEGGSSGAASGWFTGTQWMQSLATIQPSLIVVGLGVNDFGVGNGVPIATYQSNMTNILTRMRAVCTVQPTIVLIAYYEPASVTPTNPWSDYVQVLRDVAATDGGTAIFDLQTRMNPGAPSELDGMIKSDLTHPLNKGHRFIGDALAAFLSPR